MDKFKSEQLFQRLSGKEIKGYKIVNLINNGKSAAVFKAEKDGRFYALKIFDNELIERFGHEIQTKRIEQEISLKDHEINGLVKIYEGGNTEVEDDKYFYIIMEFIEGVNLKDFIQTQKYDQTFILKVLENLFNTTNDLLLQKGIAHRDIKPENIMVDNDTKIILMDLGVLKLVGAKSFSDEEEKSFVGTLRYAAPEFLLREEEDSIEGWKAVNIYQIGATLHDLISKTELFSDKNPYSNLVIAIKDDLPKVTNTSISHDLIQLTRNMLSKNWRRRLSLVSEETVKLVLERIEPEEDSFEANIEHIRKRQTNHRAKFEEIEHLKRSKTELLEKEMELGKNLILSIDECFNEIMSKDIFTSWRKSAIFKFSNDNNEKLVQNCLYEIKGELKQGFPQNLYILVRIINDEENFCEIDIWASFPSPFAKVNLATPKDLFHYNYGDKKISNVFNRYGGPSINNNFNRINIFNGIVEIDDGFKNFINSKIAKLIFVSLLKVENYVGSQLEFQQKAASTKKGLTFGTSGGLGNVIIDIIA